MRWTWPAISAWARRVSSSARRRRAQLPARDGTKARHKLLDMIAISVAAVICGADDWVSIAAFARAKEAWVCQFLDLPDGIPSHDTGGGPLERDSGAHTLCYNNS